MYLYLPKSGKAIAAAMIQSIEEVEVDIPDPASKKGKSTVQGVVVVMTGAPVISQLFDDSDEEETVQLSDTFTGSDSEVLLAWRDAGIIRQLGDLALPVPSHLMPEEEKSEVEA